MEIGIESNTSRWNTKDSWFDNLTNGIRIFNFNSPVQGHTIYNNNFNQITNEYLRLDGSRLDKISDNTFGEVDDNIGQGLKRGIVINNSSNFDIRDNDFNQLNIGIIAWNTGVGGGNIRAQNRIGENGLNTGNIFNRCYYDNITLFNNSRLRIKCNTSLNPEIIQGEYSDQNWMNLSIFQPFFPPSILAHQGHEDPNDSRKPAGNKFSPAPPYGDRRHITNHGWPYIYNAHSAPDERIPVAFTPTSIFVNTNSDDYEESYSCRPCITPYCDISAIQYKLADISESISTLYEEYFIVLEELDNGITLDLLDAISDPRLSDEDLGDLLIKNSPLSNQVIISFIERDPFVDESIFRDVIVTNSPISDSIWYYYMIDIIPSLHPEISDNLISAQSKENTIRTPALIQREIEILKTFRQVTFNDLILEMLDTEDFEDIISVLADETNTEVVEVEGNEALKLIIGTRFFENNSSDALYYLNEFEPLNNSDSAWKELMNLILSFETSDSTLYDITEAQEDFIRDLAYGDEINLPAVMAQAILRQLFGEEFDIQLPQPPSPRLSYNNDTSNTSKEGFNWNLYPNPAKDIVEITYQIPSEAIALLEVYTIFGTKTYQVLLSGNKSQIILNTTKFNSGIYLVRLTINDNFTESKKLIILK